MIRVPDSADRHGGQYFQRFQIKDGDALSRPLAGKSLIQLGDDGNAVHALVFGISPTNCGRVCVHYHHVRCGARYKTRRALPVDRQIVPAAFAASTVFL